VRREERRTLKVALGLVALGALVPIVFLTVLLTLGAAVAPDLPAPPDTPLPPLIRDALWARAEGGRAANLRPIGPMTVAQMAACVLTAPGDNDNQRIAACRHIMPALPAVEYLSNVLLRDHGVNRNSFRGGAGAMVTTVRLTRSWTRDDLLNTLAARAEFGFGWRGIEAAARGFFGRPAAALTLPQAALIASRVGDPNRTDPWCQPDAAANMRNRVLTRMREDGAIADADFAAAQVAELGLTAPPEGRPPCRP
jgi:hypothetical protein